MIAPLRCCVNEQCSQHGQPLGGDRKEFMGTLFTHGRGVLPIQIVTLYCRGMLAMFNVSQPKPNLVPGCKTTYRPNYSVVNANSKSSVREYYKGVPKYVEVTQHSYVDTDLIYLFRHQMAFSQYAFFID